MATCSPCGTARVRRRLEAVRRLLRGGLGVVARWCAWGSVLGTAAATARGLWTDWGAGALAVVAWALVGGLALPALRWAALQGIRIWLRHRLAPMLRRAWRAE